MKDTTSHTMITLSVDSIITLMPLPVH